MDQVLSEALDMPISEVRRNRENYIRAGDRSKAGPDPYFVGRKRELATFLQALELTAEEGGSCGKDETLLFQGPPGAGKTALLEECAVLAAARPTHVAMRVQADELGSVHGLIQAIDAAVGIRAARRITADLAERGGRIGPVGLGPRLGAPGSVATQLRAREDAWKEKVIVLLVDEAQNIPGEGESAEVRAIMSYLHSSARAARILLACFGLGDTQDKLAAVGVSRLAINRVATLQPLTIAQARESISRVFAACGAHGPVAERARWIDALAGLSQGWPQHMRVVTSEALEALSRYAMDLSQMPLELAIQAGQAAKERYYEQRLSSVSLWMPVYRRFAVELDRLDAPYLRQHQIAEIARPYLQEWDTKFQDFLDATVHAGVLSREDSRYTIPIPSFANYLQQPDPCSG